MSGVRLTGAAALITGASSAFGAATARRLASEGAAVALVGRRRDRLEDVATDVAGIGGASLIVEADITDPGLAEQTVAQTLDRFGRLDVLVNGAAIMLLGTALHTRLSEWDRMVKLNIEGLLHVTHAAVPYLIDAAATSQRQVADIVNVGAAPARTPQAGSSVYTLTKLGLSGFTESLQHELLGERVRVSLLEPHSVRPEDAADAIAFVVTRERQTAVSELVLRPGGPSW